MLHGLSLAICIVFLVFCPLTMLRTIVLLLLLANIGYFAWTQNGLAWAGLPRPAAVAAQASQTPAGEPLQPERIRFVRSEPAPEAATSTP
ncbi:hypothetical protein SAMN02745117_02504 [Lampropedia hyalina DSM 16112]|jgi:hypothetical protein|uniref:Uncharacterized protein n=2 Tax=Lampropedia TaxID=198705 RepID=A0A1M5E0F4_9BURK|nr:hypothetical protein SAMN02745117_02504 [Lampropedia hyalina DSM 16112]